MLGHGLTIVDLAELLQAMKDVLEEIKVAADEQNDALERIQQQLGQINNHNNLAPGERFED